MKLHANVTLAKVIASMFLSLLFLTCKASTSLLPDKFSRAMERKEQGTSQSLLGQPSQGAAQEPSATENWRQAVSKLPPEQVIALLETEFGGLFQVDVDERTISPAYLIGDFNGDGVKDIGISVRLSRDVDPNDKSKPAFSFEKAEGPGPSTLGEKGHEPTFTIGDLARYRNLPILAVIHGTRERGWRGSQPQQKFAVVDAWYLHKKTMRLYRGALKPAPNGDDPEIPPPPHLLGDAILMIIQGNTGTAVYWDGARYRWYPIDELPT